MNGESAFPFVIYYYNAQFEVQLFLFILCSAYYEYVQKCSQHCLALELLSLSIAQPQHYLAFALLSLSIAQPQHCFAVALLSLGIAYPYHCLSLALLSIGIVWYQHCLALGFPNISILSITGVSASNVQGAKLCTHSLSLLR